MASYAVTAAQSGRFSVGGLLLAGATGAVIGAATAGLLDGAGGLLSSGIDDAASSLADSAVSEATDETTESAAETVDAGAGSSGEDAGGRDGEDDPGCPTTLGGQSFTASTKVLLADGHKQPISTLKRGEKVLATDTRTGKNHAEAVTAVLVHHDRDLYDLTVRAAGRTTVIDTTSSHLFWDAGSRRWVKAAALKYGTRLRTPSGSTAVALGGYVPRQSTGWMWDLTIAPSHDFYVQAAAVAILVHNEDCETLAQTASARANELQAQVPEDSGGFVTMGVGIGRDLEGNLRTVIGTSERNGYLREGVVLKEGEELATGSGHAETNIISHMIDVVVDPIEPIVVAAGRPICPPCAEAITNAGAILGSEAR